MIPAQQGQQQQQQQQEWKTKIPKALHIRRIFMNVSTMYPHIPYSGKEQLSNRIFYEFLKNANSEQDFIYLMKTVPDYKNKFDAWLAPYSKISLKEFNFLQQLIQKTNTNDPKLSNLREFFREQKNRVVQNPNHNKSKAERLDKMMRKIESYFKFKAVLSKKSMDEICYVDRKAFESLVQEMNQMYLHTKKIIDVQKKKFQETQQKVQQQTANPQNNQHFQNFKVLSNRRILPMNTGNGSFNLDQMKQLNARNGATTTFQPTNIAPRVMNKQQKIQFAQNILQQQQNERQIISRNQNIGIRPMGIKIGLSGNGLTSHNPMANTHPHQPIKIGLSGKPTRQSIKIDLSKGNDTLNKRNQSIGNNLVDLTGMKTVKPKTIDLTSMSTNNPRVLGYGTNLLSGQQNTTSQNQTRVFRTPKVRIGLNGTSQNKILSFTNPPPNRYQNQNINGNIMKGNVINGNATTLPQNVMTNINRFIPQGSKTSNNITNIDFNNSKPLIGFNQNGKVTNVKELSMTQKGEITIQRMREKELNGKTTQLPNNKLNLTVQQIGNNQVQAKSIITEDHFDGMFQRMKHMEQLMTPILKKNIDIFEKNSSPHDEIGTEELLFQTDDSDEESEDNRSLKRKREVDIEEPKSIYVSSLPNLRRIERKRRKINESNNSNTTNNSIYKRPMSSNVKSTNSHFSSNTPKEFEELMAVHHNPHSPPQKVFVNLSDIDKLFQKRT